MNTNVNHNKNYTWLNLIFDRPKSIKAKIGKRAKNLVSKLVIAARDHRIKTMSLVAPDILCITDSLFI